MITVLIILAAFFYLVSAGVGYRFAEKGHRAGCNQCDKKVGGSTDHDWPEFAWTCIGLGWPLVIPVFLGLTMTNLNMDRAARREDKEMRRAKFMVEIAQERLKEAKALEEAERRNPLSLYPSGLGRCED